MGDLAQGFQPLSVSRRLAAGAQYLPGQQAAVPTSQWWRASSACSATTLVDDLDLDRMECLPTEYISDDLRTRRADLPWWVPFKPGKGGPAGEGGGDVPPHAAACGYPAVFASSLYLRMWRLEASSSPRSS